MMAKEKTSDSADAVLHVEHVAKSFRLPTEQASGLKQAFVNRAKGVKGYKEQHVLRDISFDVKRGDFFGIVGRNGSGKSTLLKLISGIYVPDEGRIDIKGKLVPFIELGVGFNPELTGRENVYLNGALLGFTREEIDEMYDDIVVFAELEEFMDQKLKNYSSGMQVRLAFSVAIKAQGDILVLDEVLAVGDEAFQRKCNDFFTEIKKDPSKTVILVTHSMDSVKKYCNKAILIQDGEIVVSGNKDEVADRYSLENLKKREPAHDAAEENGSERENKKNKKKQKKKPEYPTGLNRRVPLLKITAVGEPIVSRDEDFSFDIEYQFDEDKPFYVAFSLSDIKRGGISYDSGSLPINKRGHHKVRFTLPMKLFNSTDFRIVASIREDDPHDSEALDTVLVAFTNEENSCLFSVKNDYRQPDYALITKDAIDFKQEFV
ncbi:MAG: polysaccharide ABC transporter ATP-binding protein [Bifidobacteriaceae bacterium]|nr:polysaccharide ABC transporter ATP-binding protein [Bifidobacteriaceae bacterium]